MFENFVDGFRAAEKHEGQSVQTIQAYDDKKGDVDMEVESGKAEYSNVIDLSGKPQVASDESGLVSGLNRSFFDVEKLIGITIREGEIGGGC